MRISPRMSLTEQFRRFHRDRSAIALIYVTVTLPVLIGLGLLAIDVGRLTTLQSTLQHGADALALAGAAELDRGPDAITRAKRAIANLISTNTSLFGTSVVTINASAVSDDYFATLPASDVMSMTGALDPTAAASNENARFLRITVTPVNFNTIFPASFLGAFDSTTASATAVAGFDAAVCNFTPMFMCNPFEPATNTDPMRSTELYDHIASEAEKRKLIEFKRSGNGPCNDVNGCDNQWSPGNYGFLSAPIGNGANALGDVIAAVTPAACFIQNGVKTQTGNISSLRRAFNVRFDLYGGSYNKNNSAYRPAVNVRKGYRSDVACTNNPTASTDPADNVMGLPRDSCFATGNCSYGNRIGNGDWDPDGDGTPNFAAYWALNHPGRSLPPGMDNDKSSTGHLPSRYSVYRYEIDNGLVGDTSPAPGTESGTPACYQGSTPPSDTPDRRILYGAIINCIAQPLANGNSGNTYVPVAFGKFFMTEPVNGSQDSLWVELFDVVSPGNSKDVARDVVQLYR